LSDSFLQCRGEEEEVCLLERELIFISIPCLHSSLQIIRPVGSCCHKYLKKSPTFFYGNVSSFPYVPQNKKDF
jgi:hypothetical protein